MKAKTLFFSFLKRMPEKPLQSGLHSVGRKHPLFLKKRRKRNGPKPLQRGLHAVGKCAATSGNKILI